jgi:hypothetical protein
VVAWDGEMEKLRRIMRKFDGVMEVFILLFVMMVLLLYVYQNWSNCVLQVCSAYLYVKNTWIMLLKRKEQRKRRWWKGRKAKEEERKKTVGREQWLTHVILDAQEAVPGQTWQKVGETPSQPINTEAVVHTYHLSYSGV